MTPEDKENLFELVRLVDKIHLNKNSDLPPTRKRDLVYHLIDLASERVAPVLELAGYRKLTAETPMHCERCLWRGLYKEMINTVCPSCSGPALVVSTDQSPSVTAEIIFADLHTEREIHVLGDWVAVCDNITISDDGYFRENKPYIDFIALKEYGPTYSQTYYVDEDSPVEGGFHTADALQIIEELQRAIEYLKTFPMVYGEVDHDWGE